jgi:hypothetical protein
MKQNIVVFPILAVLAAAVPLNKRQDMAFSTTTEVIIDTIWSTTTLWVPPSPPSDYNNKPVSPSVAPSSSAPLPLSPAPAVPTTSSTYVAPVATTADPPMTTDAYIPPPATTTAAPVEPAPAAPSPQSNYGFGSGSSSGSGSTQGDYTGDITYYDIEVGLTSCGLSGSNSQNLVALAVGMMQNGANPNNNPLCGKKINIYYQGSAHQATIVDTCPSCTGGSLDLTPSLFKLVAPNGDGRVSGVSWSYAE